MNNRIPINTFQYLNNERIFEYFNICFNTFFLRIFFCQHCFQLVGYRKPSKLDYCFIMSTSLVPVAVSISWTEQNSINFTGTCPYYGLHI